MRGATFAEPHGANFPTRSCPATHPRARAAARKRELAKPTFSSTAYASRMQHVTAAAEGKEPALQPVGEPEPEPPGADQDREDIHQNAVAGRGEQEGPEVAVVEEAVAGQELQSQEENERVAGQLDQRAEYSKTQKVGRANQPMRPYFRRQSIAR